MSNAPQLVRSRGRHVLIKGLILSGLIVVLLALVNFSVGRSDLDGRVEDKAKRNFTPGGENNGFLSSPSDSVPNNPCFEKDGELFCGPSLYLMGIQNAGLDLLKQAIDLHPDVDCYSTGALANVSDMRDIEFSDIEDYVMRFEASTRKIRYGNDKLCICDSGRDLARPYDLDIKSGVVSPPELTTASLLEVFDYDDLRIIVILRDPTVRFIQEYCSLNMDTPFEEVVDEAIAGFLDCERNATRDNASCVYDASLSGLLQAGLYDFLIENDLRNVNEDSVRLITCDNLVDSYTRRATMESMFNFLNKDIPSPYDPYWTALDDLFVPKTGNCNEQTITAAAKQKLKDFYSTRATIFVDIA